MRMQKFITLFLVLLSFQALAGVSTFELDEISLEASNPGALKMYQYIPKSLGKNPALVVLMHGCTQTAHEFAKNSGWVKYAEAFGFVLLLPEQSSGNNSYLCFNWFNENDQARKGGEAESVAQMIGQISKKYNVNPDKVFMNGFSAGGGMTAVMMATYPELLNATAIHAGIAYACAETPTAGMFCMYGMKSFSAKELAQKVFAANPNYSGPYPRVTIWHGENDSVVKASNARQLEMQWRTVHGLEVDEEGEGDPEAEPLSLMVEKNIVRNMGHEVAIYPGDEITQCGFDSDWEKNVGICSTYQVLKFWKLIP